MQKNVGNYEAFVRGVMGAGALALAVAQRNPFWFFISAISFGSAYSRYSVVNQMFGINTYSGEHLGHEKNLRSVPTVH